jgi:hypothetical protein
MANAEGLVRIRQGAAVWNDWRARERYINLEGRSSAKRAIGQPDV